MVEVSEKARTAGFFFCAHFGPSRLGDGTVAPLSRGAAC